MHFDSSTLHAITSGVATALTPLAMALLSRMAPPRSADSTEFQGLREKHGRTEILSQLAAWVGIAGSIGICIVLKKNTPWMVGALFGWMTILPISLIAAITLRQGRQQWDEFWLFYELKYRIGTKLLLPLYGLLMGIGLISTVKLFEQ